MKTSVLRLLVVCVCAFAWRAQAQTGPTVTIEQKRVIASKVTRGGSVTFVSTGLGSDGYTSFVQRTNAILTDDDKDNSVTLDVPKGVPWRSVWVVADTNSGQYTVAFPAGYDGALNPDPPLFRASKNVDFDEILLTYSAAFLYYIHPSGGVWELSARDGGGGDSDGQANGVATARLTSFQPVSPTKEKDRPKGLQPGGILIVFNPDDMSVFSVRLTGNMLNGGGK